MQGRAQRTLNRILKATEQLLDKMPWEEVSIAEIVRLSRTSVGSFYARFKGKEDLLCALAEQYIEEGRATVEALFSSHDWSDTPLADLIAQMVRIPFEVQSQRKGLRRALVLAATNNPELQRRNAELAEYTIGHILRYVETRRAEIDHPDLSLAIHVAHRAVYSIVEQELVYTAAPPTKRKIEQEVLIEQITEMCIRFLGVQRPG